MIALIGSRKVHVSADGVAAFNRTWPGSSLRSTRAYWFEFEGNGIDGDAGDMIDCDVPDHDDGPAASAMADDCRAYLESGIEPDWAGGRHVL